MAVDRRIRRLLHSPYSDISIERIFEILKAARTKIQQGWVQGPWAVDKDGWATSSTGEHACAWCSAGAVKAVSKIKEFNEVMDLLNTYVWRWGHAANMIGYNEAEGRTQEDVLKIFDDIIEVVQEMVDEKAQEKAEDTGHS